MDMNTGVIHLMSEEEDAVHKKNIAALTKNAGNLIVDNPLERQMMGMSDDQVKAVQGMPNRKARRHMMKQPCDCGSGKQARKCCFKHL